MADETSPFDERRLESPRWKQEQEGYSEVPENAPSPEKVSISEDRPGGSGGRNRERRITEERQKPKRVGAAKEKIRNNKRPSATTTPPNASSVEAESGGQQNKKNKSKYAVRKRVPPSIEVEIRPNDVFVNEKSHILAQISRCKKLFENGNREIYLHGLGKAIPKALNIAFDLKTFYHDTVDYTVNTSTVQISDDFIPVDDPDQPAIVRKRNVSSVDIKIYRSVNIP